jgi:GTP-binding protein EngB required for normal cell division
MINDETKQQKWQQLKDLFQSFDWQETRERVDRESRARIVFLGRPQAGKSTLLNQVCGWPVSPPPRRTHSARFPGHRPTPTSRRRVWGVLFG